MKGAIFARPSSPVIAADQKRADQQNDRTIQQDFAVKPAVHGVAGLAVSCNKPEGGHDGGGLHDRGGGNHVAFGCDPAAFQYRGCGDKSHDGDRAVVCGDGCLVDCAEAGHRAQKGESDERQDERQDARDHQCCDKSAVDPVGCNACAAFEADGEEKIDRHPLGHGLGDGQVGTR